MPVRTIFVDGGNRVGQAIGTRRRLLIENDTVSLLLLSGTQLQGCKRQPCQRSAVLRCGLAWRSHPVLCVCGVDGIGRDLGQIIRHHRDVLERLASR